MKLNLILWPQLKAKSFKLVGLPPELKQMLNKPRTGEMLLHTNKNAAQPLVSQIKSVYCLSWMCDSHTDWSLIMNCNWEDPFMLIFLELSSWVILCYEMTLSSHHSEASAPQGTEKQQQTAEPKWWHRTLFTNYNKFLTHAINSTFLAIAHSSSSIYWEF